MSLKQFFRNIRHKPYITHEGYIQVYNPKHPRSRDNGYVPEHINNYSKEGKINIPKNLVIHHKDGNKLNNSRKNLQLITRQEHTKIHNLKKKSSRT